MPDQTYSTDQNKEEDASPILSPREEARQITRDRLIKAALQVFTEKGFRTATIDEITRKARINRTTFYSHFKTKSEIAAEYTHAIISDTVALYRTLDGLNNPTRKQVRKWLDDAAEMRRRNKILHEIMHEALVSDADTISNYGNVLEQIVRRAMEKYLSKYPSKERNAACTRMMLIEMMLERYFFLSDIYDMKFPTGDAMEQLTDIVHSTLTQKS